jgi:hypothetical protein
MENLTNATSLSEIVFPVFKIGIHKPIVENGLVFYYHEREYASKEDTVTEAKYNVVDDRNLLGATLAQRRLQLTVEEVPLAKLSNAVYFLGDLIKIADPKLWFIDSAGKLFNYKRTTRAKLKFYKISQLIPIKTGGVIVEVEGLSQRFKALYKPTEDKLFVGVLHFGVALILYGFYDQKHTETWILL